MSSKFDAFIVDPELDPRTRLKHATSLLAEFRRVTPFASPELMLAHLERGARPDIIFLSESLGLDRIGEFIDEAKAITRSSTIAYILVLKGRQHDITLMALSVLAGGHAFLIEPYSVTSLLDIVAVAAGLREDLARKQEDRAIRGLVRELRTRLSYITTLQSLGYDIVEHVRRLKQRCAVLQRLSPRAHETYQRLLIEAFEQAGPPGKREHVRALTNASKRVKQRAVDGLMQRINRGVGNASRR